VAAAEADARLYLNADRREGFGRLRVLGRRLKVPRGAPSEVVYPQESNA
jgi:hypothetical protein